MAKSVLIESRLNSLKLCESKGQPRKGCLGRMEGICADFANPTRNGRFYSRELWENVFNSDLVKEALESKTLIGELDHPEDRFEPLAQEACVVLTDYSFDDENQVLRAGFDILDTQKGRILKSLLDYGCVMGVSSRGQGDTVQNGDYEEVDPDTYDFACFDVVLTPAVQTARQAVVESAKVKSRLKALEESFHTEIKNAKSVNELDNLKAVVEATQLPNAQNIVSAIDTRCKSLTEGKTISEQTKEDLHTAKIKINRLERQIEKLNAKTINEQREHREALEGLATKILAYQHRESRLSENLAAARQNTLELKKQLIAKDRKVAAENAATVNVESKLTKATDTVTQLSERLGRAEHNITKANVARDKACDALKESRRELMSVKREKAIADKTIKDLQEEIANLNSENSRLSNKLDESVKAQKAEAKSLAEAADRAKQKTLAEQKKLSENLSDMRESYIRLAAQHHGLKESTVHSLVNESMTATQIDEALKEERNRQDRYNALPFHTGNVKPTMTVESTSIHSSHEDSEMAESKAFMERVAGLTE